MKLQISNWVWRPPWRISWVTVILTSQHLAERGHGSLSAGDFERGQTAMTSFVEIELGNTSAGTSETRRANLRVPSAFEPYERLGARRSTDGVAAFLKQIGAPNAVA